MVRILHYYSNVTSFYISQYPLMWKRLFYHLLGKKSIYKPKSNTKREWVMDLMFYVLDLSFIPLFYALVIPFYKRGLRPLDDLEKQVAKAFYKNSINLDYVWMHPKMPKHIRKFALAYVSQNVINFQEDTTEAIFIHELMHIWQYQRYGMVYIYRALKAQNSNEGYNYGAQEGVINGMYRGRDFTTYNFEQQAQMMEDYYKLNQMEMYMPLSHMEMAGYNYFYMQVINE